jgi:metallophosphoesterase (TIGR00282 family)
MLGDVVGRPGRQAVARYLPQLVKEHRPDIVVANGENAAGGLGISRDTALPLFAAGVEVITLGNHVWAQKGAEELYRDDERVIRPANLPPGLAGRGGGVFKTRSGAKLGVINLLGRTFMEPMDDPFRAADIIIEEIRQETPVILVDMHAEATSEKGALAWYLDGRVSAVVGTHTHVATCDERILPKGTAFLTDVGMVGPRDSILGVKIDAVLEKFLKQTRLRFEVADGPVIMNGVVLEVDDDTGRASSISRISVVED